MAFRLKKLSGYQKRQWMGAFFVSPAMIFVFVMFIIPLFMTIYLSFTDWPLVGDPEFILFDNYTSLVKDQMFWRGLRFTTIYTIAVTPPIFLFAFFLANLINTKRPGVSIFRTGYFLPVCIGLSVSCLLWIWLFNDRVGIINKILEDVGIIEKPIIWLRTLPSALTMIIVSVVWKTVGFTMIILLGGLQAIPNDLYEAADVDGANWLQKLTNITLPLLRRTFALALILSVIGSFLGFDPFYLMTQGGPKNQTISIVYWIYKNGFLFYKMGYASALSLILLVILVGLSILQLYLLRDETKL
jgi:multiple sugar transport system permease protein